MRGLPALLVALLVLVAPAHALAGTLDTTAATGVQIRGATLNGSATGYPAGAYCAFVYGLAAGGGPGANISSPPYPAAPCGTASGTGTVSYSTAIGGLTPGETYFYASVHCAATQTSQGVVYCATTYAAPYGWDAVAQCAPYNQSTPPCPTFTMGMPTGTTQPATAVRGTSAMLNATIQVQDEDPSLVSYHFDYSTDPQLVGSTSTPSVSLAGCTPSAGTCPAAAQLSGLAPGTVYYARVVVASGETGHGPTAGNIVSFKTGGFVATGPATNVTTTSATLNAEVDAGDADLAYSWLFSSSATTSNGVLSDPGTRTLPGATVPAGSDQDVMTAVSGLSPLTTYYVQVVTNDPAIHGAVVALTTPAVSCPRGQSSYVDQRLGATGFVVRGCWSSSKGVFDGHGPVSVNGLVFSAPPGATLTIDTNADKISTSTGYGVSMGTTLLADRQVSAAFTSSTSGANVTSTVDLATPQPGGTLIQLPLGGEIVLNASSAGGSTVGVTALGLPNLFGGVTAEGSAAINQDGSVAGVHAQLGDSTIGPLTLPGFTLDGDLATNSWTGHVNLMLPLAKYGVAATVRIKDGRLNGLGGSFDGPGIPLDDSGLVLNGGGFDSTFSPLTLQGNVDLSVGPKIGGVEAIGISAGFYAGFDQNQTLSGLPGIPDGTQVYVPFTLGTNGTISLLGFLQMVNSSARYYGVPGWPLVGIQASLAQPLKANCGSYGIGITPSLQYGGDARGAQFNLVGSGGVEIDLCVLRFSISATSAISTAGLGICGSYNGNSVGAGVTWPGSIRSLADIVNSLHLYTAGGCDIGTFEAPISLRAAVAHAAAVAPLRLPPGLPFAVVKVQGQGAPPLVTVSGPGGRTITMAGIDRLTSAPASYLVIPDAHDDTTYVELTRPAGGTYDVMTQPGSAPITAISVAHGQPAPSLRGSIRARGRTRVLTWSARALPGQRLAFHELGAGGARPLLTTSRPSGRFTFTPLPGVAGPRYVVADIYEHGMLEKAVRVGRFTAPRIVRPHRPGGVVLVLRHRILKIAWRATAGADHYAVFVTTADGRRRLFVTRHTRLAVAGVRAARGTIVTVTAVNALGQGGPQARARPR